LFSHVASHFIICLKYNRLDSFSDKVHDKTVLFGLKCSPFCQVQLHMRLCPGGEIGRHKGFKIPRSKGRAGSSPAPGTISSAIYRILFFSACFNLTFSKFPYRA
jgi:hypothetical protein